MECKDVYTLLRARINFSPLRTTYFYVSGLMQMNRCANLGANMTRSTIDAFQGESYVGT